MTSRLLAKLEDFRLLPIFVIVSMVIGIGIGNLLSISDFALTPPIEAIKSIAGGTFEISVPTTISLGVPIGLFVMMYPAMTNVRLGEVAQPSARRANWASCCSSTTSSRRSSCSGWPTSSSPTWSCAPA